MGRLAIEVARTLDAPPGAVWAMLGGFDLAWHPDLAACRLDGRRRHLTLPDGSTMVERLFYLSDSEHRLGYGLEGSDYRAEIDCRPSGAGTEVRWRANPTADAAGAVRTLFERGLTALADRLTIRPLRTGPGGRIAALAAGAGTPVLFLHGIGGTKENWAAELHALAPAARGIALDLQGYGESTLPDGPMTLAGLLADLDAVLDELAPEGAHLVGLSMGAWIAASYAATRAPRVKSLTCAGGFLGMSATPPAGRAAFLAPRLAPLDAGETPASLAPGIWARLRAPAPGPGAEAAFRASMAAIPAAAYRRALHCFTDPPGPLDLGALTMPVLALTGEHDALAPPAEIAAVARALVARGCPFVRHEVVAGAGHLVNLDRPEPVSRLLRAFLAATS